jgi:two-component system, cell cycle sensor histidine kinase PleC
MREGRETVLVVDDEPQVLVALEDILSDDFLVLKSESAEAALELVEREPDIAVVLADQRMPRMQGDELFACLRRRIDAERILSTGYADLPAVVRAVNDGQIFAYVTKPWNAEELRAKMRRAAAQFRLRHDLAQERKLLEDLMNSMPEAIYFKDRDLKFRRVNTAFQKLMGGHNWVTTCIGRTLSELVPNSALVQDIEQQERELLAEGRAAIDNARVFEFADAGRLYSMSMAPVRGHNGDAAGLVAIARDVTARCAMEDLLRSNEERLRLISIASSAGSFDWDMANGAVQAARFTKSQVPV